MSNDLDHLLSDEERAALAEDSPTDTLPVETVDDGKPADAKPAEGETKPAEGETTAAENETKPGDEVKPAEIEAKPPRVFAPEMIVPEVPEDADAKLKSLREQFDNGEITLDAYTEQRESIVWAVRQADYAKQQNEANRAAVQREVWDQTVRDFLDDHPEYKDPILFDGLDGQLRRLGKEEANADKTAKWFLTQAHTNVMAVFKAADPAKVDPAKVDPAKVPEVRELKPRAPQTLATVPSSGAPAAGGGEFAHLENMSGLELESAVAKMTQAQRDRYMAAA